ncbi:MAG: hypothetical protein ACXWT1_11475 [Methylobacter sp.]
MPLPLILAGPILRRVEPRLVTVWVALREACTLEIKLWNGLVKDDSGATSFSGPANLEIKGALVNSAATIRIGDQLHIGVATFKLPAEKALSPQSLYSYNLTLINQAGVEEDLKSLKLLRNDDIDGKPNLCLGYEPNFLPSLSLSPMNLTDLRIVHGSCRRINNMFEDGLSWVDDFIAEARNNQTGFALKRPHQLFLTGDQIYADDVPLPLLPPLLKLGNELLGKDKVIEFLPAQWPEKTKATYWPADAKHFPPGLRQQLIASEARLTTTDTHSHLISFGEFAAMYLFVWSNALWDLNELKDFDDIIHEIKDRARQQIPDQIKIKLQTLEKALKDFDDISRKIKDLERQEFTDQIKAMLETLGKALNEVATNIMSIVKDVLRSIDDILPAIVDDFFPTWGVVLRSKEEWGDKDELFLEIFVFLLLILNEEELRLAMREVDFSNLLNEEKLRVYNENDWQGLIKLYAFATSHMSDDLRRAERFFTDFKKVWGGLYKKPKDDTRKQQVEMFFNTLTKVRRALANVPTYMMFDDHEVTDDWNLNPLWRDRVLTSPLGRTIMRNGLVAYALFQGWGNDPEGFAKGKQAELLTLATQLFPSGNTTPPQEETAVANKINLLLGLDGSDPPVKWHFTVPGARHLVLAIDNRTRRGFVSRLGPPSNLSPAALLEQIPAGPLAAGFEVLFVIAPLPVLGPPVLDELVAPLVYRVFDMFEYKNVKGMPGTHPDAIEAWAFDPKTFEALLKRLQPYRRVVFFSGDVHYGSSQVMSYWRKDDKNPAQYLEPTRFAQFTSSGMRNVMPAYIGLVDRSLPLGHRIIRAKIGAERLGWDQNSPEPLKLPAEARIVPTLRAKLKQSPVMISTEGWPEGTAINSVHLPDWRWRVDPLFDERPDHERPLAAQPEPLAADLKTTDLETTLKGYREIIRRHARQLDKMKHGRQILFVNNLGVVRFENRPAKENIDKKEILHAIHELYAVHPLAQDPAKPELFTFHVTPLELEKPFDALPTIGGGT